MAIPNDPILEETISPVLPSDAKVVVDQDINGNEILNAKLSNLLLIFLIVVQMY